jgi:hypothetical protein
MIAIRLLFTMQLMNYETALLLSNLFVAVVMLTTGDFPKKVVPPPFQKFSYKVGKTTKIREKWQKLRKSVKST